MAARGLRIWAGRGGKRRRALGNGGRKRRVGRERGLLREEEEVEDRGRVKGGGDKEWGELGRIPEEEEEVGFFRVVACACLRCGWGVHYFFRRGSQAF